MLRLLLWVSPVAFAVRRGLHWVGLVRRYARISVGEVGMKTVGVRYDIESMNKLARRRGLLHQPRYRLHIRLEIQEAGGALKLRWKRFTAVFHGFKGNKDSLQLVISRLRLSMRADKELMEAMKLQRERVQVYRPHPIEVP